MDHLHHLLPCVVLFAISPLLLLLRVPLWYHFQDWMVQKLNQHHWKDTSFSFWLQTYLPLNRLPVWTLHQHHSHPQDRLCLCVFCAAFSSPWLLLQTLLLLYQSTHDHIFKSPLQVLVSEGDSNPSIGILNLFFYHCSLLTFY